KVLRDTEQQKKAKALCDGWLGDGAFEDILRQSTYMPVHDYVLCVRRWHNLPVEAEGGFISIGALDPQRRVEKLREVVVNIIGEAINATSSLLPSDMIVQEWGNRCLGDLALEARAPTREQAEKTLVGYAGLKSSKKRATSLLQCCQ